MVEPCLLCLEMNNEDEDSIKVNSTQWQELNVKNLIDKHFWPMMQTIQLSSWLCAICWKQLNDFHSFYERVEHAHMNLSTVFKLETTNEPHFEREIVIQDTLVPDTITNESRIIQQDQHTEDLSDDDDIPLAVASKNVRLNKTLNKDPLHTTKKPKSTKTTKLKIKQIIKTPNETCDNRQTELKEDDSLLGTNENSDDDFSTNSDSNSELEDQDSSEICEKKITRSNISKGINDAKNKFISENFKITCDICQLSFETFQELLIHFNAEHNQQGYVLCCDKKYVKRNLFLDHLHHHVDPNYLKCKECDKVFANSRGLKGHRKVHEINRSKNFCCDICGMNFFSRHGLQSHKTRHLTDEEKNFPCPECPKKFGSKGKVSDHVKLIHGTKEVCDICGLILVNKCALKRHKSLKHMQQEKPEYVCPICSKVSANQLGIDTHIKNVHQRGYNHKCTICDRAFKIKIALKEHMATHTGTDLYACTWCPKTCKSIGYMHSHRKKCHPREWAEEKRKKYSGNLPPDVKLILSEYS